ncbi:hypothetical protein [Achromobacter ruhlandii]|uniref:hypothetical protein n=1 Tax=Achromobacter ruhlandii TaxID=72557 RepID=UPI0008658FCD|nr:hypothetical protein [Achromobacter ruhlandii]AOU90988.1 uncharacterized protein AruCF_0097 [Achromobacter ruhlandii]MCZ8433899.1 hypothetical protein [Achromobacter ruhlandii]MDC6089071.1 hypothetical protein [Achromobacter ruhlandii]MDC6152292.1 hypothetical protein [Achromobacter ruhlandii]MDD7982430.1 hypothetical protein [Achromobacter ruhlandii]
MPDQSLFIELVIGPRDIAELSAKWRQDEPLGAEDQFPDVADAPLKSEDVL